MLPGENKIRKYGRADRYWYILWSGKDSAEMTFEL